MNFIIAILSSLTANFLITFFSGRNLNKFIPNPILRFWNPLFKDKLIIITPAEEKEKIIKSQVLDFEGLNKLMGIFHKYYRNRFIQTNCEVVSQEMLNHNLLLIAGPIPNSITRHIFKSHKDNLRYNFEGNDIIDRENPSKPIKVDFPKGKDHPTTDYGIISCITNPFNHQKKVLISSGAYGWGTYAGQVALTDKESLKKLIDTTKQKDFQILVKIGVYRRIPEIPELLMDSLHLIVEEGNV